MGNFRIHCLEWDYPVDNSGLHVDLQWISVFIRVLSRKYFIWSVKFAGLYMTIIIFPVQYDVNQATNGTKIKFTDNVCLSGSLPICFLYNILVLNFRAKGN